MREVATNAKRLHDRVRRLPPRKLQRPPWGSKSTQTCMQSIASIPDQRWRWRVAGHHPDLVFWFSRPFFACYNLRGRPRTIYAAARCQSTCARRYCVKDGGRVGYRRLFSAPPRAGGGGGREGARASLSGGGEACEENDTPTTESVAAAGHHRQECGEVRARARFPRDANRGAHRTTAPRLCLAHKATRNCGKYSWAHFCDP